MTVNGGHNTFNINNRVARKYFGKTVSEVARQALAWSLLEMKLEKQAVFSFTQKLQPYVEGAFGSISEKSLKKLICPVGWE
ncbi:MAG: hypothetical protein QME06_10050 [Desulfobacterales bacterium]|nr:hypothetical protein [Desulfobacterales bacterium]